VSTGRKLWLAARATLGGLLALPGRALRGFTQAPLDDVVRYPDDVLPV
jgi:hypothetical protein